MYREVALTNERRTPREAILDGLCSALILASAFQLGSALINRGSVSLVASVFPVALVGFGAVFAQLYIVSLGLKLSSYDWGGGQPGLPPPPDRDWWRIFIVATILLLISVGIPVIYFATITTPEFFNKRNFLVLVLVGATVFCVGVFAYDPKRYATLDSKLVFWLSIAGGSVGIVAAFQAVSKPGTIVHF